MHADSAISGSSQGKGRVQPQPALLTATADGGNEHTQNGGLAVQPDMCILDSDGDTPINPSTGSHNGESASQRIAHGALVQQTIRRYGSPEVYWERQTEEAMCGVHAVNSLLQRKAVDSAYMHRVADEIDQRERALLNGVASSHSDGNARPNGDYTIQVIQETMRRFDGGMGPHGHPQPSG